VSTQNFMIQTHPEHRRILTVAEYEAHSCAMARLAQILWDLDALEKWMADGSYPVQSAPDTLGIFVKDAATTLGRVHHIINTRLRHPDAIRLMADHLSSPIQP
jgi:hypothetical protein